MTEKKVKIFDIDRIEAIKVIFKKPIFEDDFPEKGMKAWLIDIIKNEKVECYDLYFDFSEFEKENEKYFKANYYDKNSIPCLTAKEAGLYNPKYNVYFGDIYWDEDKIEEELKKCLKIIS